MSSIRTLLIGSFVIGGFWLAYLLFSMTFLREAVTPQPIKETAKHQIPAEYGCITVDCWGYLEEVLLCASGEHNNRYLNDDKTAHCRLETYVCMAQDCTAERDIRARQEYQEIIQSIGQRVWHSWSNRSPDDLSAQIMVHIKDNGSVAHADVLESSGSSEFDSQATEAIYEAQPFNEIRAAEPEIRALLSRVVLSFGGVNVQSMGAR
ncbi:TonB family protein [Halomonas sp. 86]|uniref:TonB family protein n=1 Tax=unclassified Halomonas TaxID=2609666 RepID=UPI004034534F